MSTTPMPATPAREEALVRVRLIIKALMSNPDDSESITEETEIPGGVPELDSLDMIEMVMTAEDLFDVRIHDQDAQNIKTVGDLVSLVLQASR